MRDRPRPGDARAVALAVLGQLEDEQAFLQPALQATATRAALDPRDRGLALELVMGVERWRLRLDHALEPHVTRGLAHTDPLARRILRLAAYQLLYLDRIPARAAVHSAVDLARAAHGEGVARFVNGVLRGLTRDLAALPEGDAPEAISIRHSQPLWLVARWHAAHGPAHATALAEAHNRPAPLTLRVAGDAPDRDALADRLRAEGATVRATRYSPDGLHLEDHPAPFEGESFRDGWWQAQDEASQLVIHLLDAQPGDRIWDVCAAPGGKTRAIARQMGHGFLLATDLNPLKAERLGRLLRQHAHVSVRTHDAQQPLPAGALAASEATTEAAPLSAADGGFDRVLVDAPCTGLGVMRRHPELKWRRTEADLHARTELQRRILATAADAVRPGGLLVYSVCSDTPEEGPEQIDAFLAARPDYVLDPPPEGAVDWSPLTDGRGCLRLDPHTHGADGFFAARLRRAAEAS